MSQPNSECKLLFFDMLHASPDAQQSLRATCRGLFTHLPLVDFYFDDPKLAPYLIFGLILVTAPLCFLYAATVAQRFLAVEMKRLAGVFQMSQSLAAVTLLAFAGSAPDIIAALSHNRHADSTTIMASMGMGVYFFGMTAITGVVSLLGPSVISIPKAPLIKEIIFSLAIVLSVAFVGWKGQVNYWFVGWLLFLILAYLVTSLMIEKLTQATPNSKINNPSSGQPDKRGTNDELDLPEAKKGSKNKDLPQEVYVSTHTQDLQHTLSDSQELAMNELSKSLAHSSYNNHDKLNGPTSLLLLPLTAVQTATIPYPGNFLLNTLLEVGVPFLGSVLAIYVFEISESHLWTVIFSFAVGIAFTVFRKLAPHSVGFTVFRSVLIVGVSLAWIQFFISIVIDYLTFITFYYSANDVILRSFLLASGTSIGELFGSHALASAGAEIMAVLSVYSGSFLNIALVLIINTLYHIEDHVKEFDIFGLTDMKDGLSTESIYVIGFTALTVGVLLTHAVVFAMNGFKTSRAFGGFLLGLYAIVFIVTISLGVN